MESVKDKRVGRRGLTQFVREGGIDEVDEQGIGEEGDCLIVIIMRGYVVWSAREHIRGTEVLARNMFKGQVELGEL